MAFTLARLYEEKPSFGDYFHRSKSPIITEVSSTTRKSKVGLHLTLLHPEYLFYHQLDHHQWYYLVLQEFLLKF